MSPKDPVEKVVVTFDFSAISGTISNPVVTVNRKGYDVSIAAMLSGSASIVNNTVLQMIQGGENGQEYDIRCVVDVAASGEKYVAKDTLTVKY